MESQLDDWRRELEASTVTGVEKHRATAPIRVPALTILHHPDPGRVGEVAPLAAVSSGRVAELSRLEPHFAPPRGGDLRPLADAHLSRRPLRLVGQAEDGVRIETADCSTELHVDTRPVDGASDLAAADLDAGVTLRLADRVVLLLHRRDPTPRPEDDLGLVGESVAMDRFRRDLRRAARLDAPVLLRGETGSGKELAAAAIHRSSERRGGEFVAVNMAAIAPSLAASELFGAVKGAFTGAAGGRDGLFRRAHGGTLLLDEIGEAPVELQALLLRAIESGRVLPVGADRPVPVDVRILAATDADLEQLVAAGDFRAPLIHRLAGLVVQVPELRRRRDDVPRLLHHFLRLELDALGALDRLRPAPRGRRPWLPATLIEQLVHHPWPGNVRQLRNVARQLAAAGFEADELDERLVLDALADRDLPAEGGDGGEQSVGEGGGESHDWRGRPSLITEQLLRRTLRRQAHKLAPTAAHLGISRTSLYGLLDRFAIRRASQVDGPEIEAGLARHGGDLEALACELEVSAAGLRQRWRQWRDLAARPAADEADRIRGR